MRYLFFHLWDSFSQTHSFWKKYEKRRDIYNFDKYTKSCQVLRGHRRCGDLLGDFCDGSAYESHPLFSEDRSALEVMIYYDDVEVCNPLGSRTKKHKLGMYQKFS